MVSCLVASRAESARDPSVDSSTLLHPARVTPADESLRKARLLSGIAAAYQNAQRLRKWLSLAWDSRAVGRSWQLKQRRLTMIIVLQIV